MMFYINQDSALKCAHGQRETESQDKVLIRINHQG